MSIRLWTYLFSIAGGFALAFASFRFLHMLQLESYQGRMYNKWIERKGQRDLYACVLVGVIALFLRIAWLTLYYQVSEPVRAILMYGADAVYIAGFIMIGFLLRRRPEKKKLVFTGRVIRLLAALFIICFVFHNSFFIVSRLSNISDILIINTLRYLPGIMLPYFVLLAYLLLLPLENLIKKYYFNDANAKIKANQDLMRVGITGSYGKTSTKFILSSILSEKYNTLMTPGSFNTPMGIAKVVRGELSPEHEVFIAEMGARYKGDIDELCRLVEPKCGIITSVGKQHLETFESFENVVAEKARLISSLPDDGAIFINADIDECRRMYDECQLENKFLFGLDTSGLYMSAKNIRVTTSGSVFELEDEKGNTVECKCSLLGKHNILNITGAAALALYMGLSLEQIANGIEKVEPIEHRLRLIEGPITVIDDAFNANPKGASSALEVLKSFAPLRRVVVTPGLVELGDEQEELNHQLGLEIAASVDAAIIVGKENQLALMGGMIEGGMDENSIATAQTLDDVTPLLPTFAPHGSVVLFENDLPDNYL